MDLNCYKEVTGWWLCFGESHKGDPLSKHKMADWLDGSRCANKIEERSRAIFFHSVMFKVHFYRKKRFIEVLYKTIGLVRGLWIKQLHCKIIFALGTL